MQELHSGFTIKGKYQIVEKQGEGTLGTVVYLGKDTEKKCEIIIRVLPPNLLADDEMVSRFMQGIDLAKKLKHPNILTVLDAGEEDGIQYLITNYVKGFFLNDYLEHRGQLDENESIRLVKALAMALSYAWNEQQIVHRNVCPDTILVAKGNVPMLTDFDLAKSLVTDSKLTVGGFTVGDPVYMSPEQAKGERVDFHSDIYCLGLVFYHLLTGKPPFCDKSRMDILRDQITEKHATIQSINKSITDACATVLDKMLEKQTKDRYQSWTRVIDDFDAILNQEPPSTLQKVILSSTSSRYKMQAIQMEAVKIPIASQEVTPEPKPPEEKAPTAAAASKTEPASAPSEAKSNLSMKRNVTIIIAVAVILVISGLVLGLISRQKNSPESSSTQADPSQVLPSVKTESKIKTKPVVQLKTETKPVVKVAASADDKARDEKHRKACRNNIKQIGVALQMYANVFEGKFPEPDGTKGLDLLRSGGFLELPQVFICPTTGNIAASPGKPITEECCDYVYVGGLSEYSDGKTPLMWSKSTNHKDFGIILYVNGDIKDVPGSNWLSKTKKK